MMSESPAIEEGASQPVCMFIEFCTYITGKMYVRGKNFNNPKSIA